jgi:hypothetical protein
MKAKVRNNVLILLIAGLLGTWGCSSGPKPAAKPKPPDASTQAAPAAGQENQSPAATQKQSTSIPAEELELPPAPLESGDQEKTATGDDDASTLEEAMNACQEAEQLWERGDFDAALATLDSAYGLLLKCDLPRIPRSARKRTTSA